MTTKKVLVAHQSTIPYYRIAFYQAVERLRPSWWEFSVVYDEQEARQVFLRVPNPEDFTFPTETCQTFSVRLCGKRLILQTFPLKSWKYDLVIVGSALDNLSYPLTFFARLLGTAVAYWGHGRDCSVKRATGIERLEEKTKIWLARKSNGFFAYTQGVRDYMTFSGVENKKIFTLYNTIDIERQRQNYEKMILQRDSLRKEHKLEGKKVLLFVGRFHKQKGLDFLVKTFSFLKKKDSSYHMLLVGGGDLSFFEELKVQCGVDSVSYGGVVYDDSIGDYYVMSDIYVIPGAVGLGPLQALCYDLTPAVIESDLHKPEYEYLNKENALVVCSNATPEDYGLSIDDLLSNYDLWKRMRMQAWPSIRHLTIASMAKNFVDGVDRILSWKCD